MEPSYTIRADDGNEYGPANLEQIIGWIREGRVSPQTELRRSDMEHWSPASSFTELQSIFTPATAAPPTISAPPAGPDGDPATVAQLKSGASWFYWIAGLSLVNSVAALAGVNWRFIFGLGVTQVLDAVGTEMGGAGKGIVFLLDLIVAGIFVLFGVFANKRHLWAFIVGLVLFAIDTVLMLVFQDWLSLALHGYVIFCLFRGLQACRELNAK